MKIVRTDSDSVDFRSLVKDLDEYLAEVDGDDHAYYAQFNGLDKIHNVVVAYDGAEPVGCGAFKPYSETTAEVKRMFVRPGHRGRRIGVMVLEELERWASEVGYSSCILETGHRQTAAVKLYQRAGYEVIPNYDQYAEVEGSVCMKKQITRETGAGV
jgi:putative acetyltransferase